jgi:hypothetical protein
MSRFLPRASCVPRAFTVFYLLPNALSPAGRVKIGVRKVGGSLEAHAWVTLDEAVVIGGDGVDLTSYVTLLDFGNDE